MRFLSVKMTTKVRWRSRYRQEASVDTCLCHYHQVCSVFLPHHGPFCCIENQMHSTSVQCTGINWNGGASSAVVECGLRRTFWIYGASHDNREHTPKVRLEHKEGWQNSIPLVPQDDILSSIWGARCDFSGVRAIDTYSTAENGFCDKFSIRPAELVVDYLA